MQVCPQCRQQVPAPSGNSVGWAFLWGGVGLLSGILGTCLISFLAVTMIGSRSQTTFTTVGQSLSAGS